MHRGRFLAGKEADSWLRNHGGGEGWAGWLCRQVRRQRQKKRQQRCSGMWPNTDHLTYKSALASSNMKEIKDTFTLYFPSFLQDGVLRNGTNAITLIFFFAL